MGLGCRRVDLELVSPAASVGGGANCRRSCVGEVCLDWCSVVVDVPSNQCGRWGALSSPTKTISDEGMGIHSSSTSSALWSSDKRCTVCVRETMDNVKKQ